MSESPAETDTGFSERLRGLSCLLIFYIWTFHSRTNPVVQGQNPSRQNASRQKTPVKITGEDKILAILWDRGTYKKCQPYQNLSSLSSFGNLITQPNRKLSRF